MMYDKAIEPREPTFELNQFDEPLEAAGPDAWIRDVVAMAFYEPGTFVTDPTLGVYINSEVYNFTDTSANIIRSKMMNACRKYLTDVPLDSLDVSTYYWEEMDTYVVVLSVTFKYEHSLRMYAAHVAVIDHQLRYIVSQLA